MFVYQNAEGGLGMDLVLPPARPWGGRGGGGVSESAEDVGCRFLPRPATAVRPCPLCTTTRGRMTFLRHGMSVQPPRLKVCLYHMLGIIMSGTGRDHSVFSRCLIHASICCFLVRFVQGYGLHMLI